MGRLSDARKKARKKAVKDATPQSGDAQASVEKLDAEGTAVEKKTRSKPKPKSKAAKAPEAEKTPEALPKPESATSTPPATDIVEQPDFPVKKEEKGKAKAAARKRQATKEAPVLPASGLAEDILRELARREDEKHEAAGESASPEEVAASPDLQDKKSRPGDDFKPLSDEAWDALVGGDGAAPGEINLRSLPSSGLADEILAAVAEEDSWRRHSNEQDDEDFHDREEVTEQLLLVHFSVGTETYAIEIDRVQEIIRVPAITRVPNTALHVKGVFNLRGRIVAVFDLRRLLKLPDRDIDKASRIMVLDLNGKVLGMLIDRVVEVAGVDVSEIEPAPEEVVAIDANLVSGVARHRERMVFLLDMDRILGVR